MAKSYEPRFIGCDKNQVVLIEMAGRLRNRMEVARYDLEQNELARAALTEDKNVECYGGYVNGEYVDLLMAETKENGLKVYRHRLDTAKLEIVDQPLTLADYKGTQGDRMGFALGVSQNQQLLAGIYAIGREGQLGEVQVGLYSRELEEYWKMDSRCRRMEMMYVTDSGEVLLGNYVKGKYNLYIMDGEQEEEYSFEADATFSEIRIARYAEGKVYFVYTHSDKPDWREPGTMINYVGVICFDTKTQRVSVERHSINKVEYNRLENQKDDARVKNEDYRLVYGSLNQTIEEDDGFYAMLDQTWRVTINGVPTEYHRMGMMVCHIDNEGKFEWVKSFRISTIASWEARNLASYRWVKGNEGLMLFWVESKSSAENPEEKPVKDFKALNSAGVLTAMLLRKDGSSERQHFEIASKQSLLGGPHQLDDGEYLMLMRGVTRGYFAKTKKK